MANKCFITFGTPAAGDSDGLSPINPVNLLAYLTVVSPDNLAIEGPPAVVVEVGYSSTLASIKADAQSAVHSAYSDPSITFVWLDDRGLL